MSKRPPVLQFAAAVAAYLALCFVVPQAFFVKILGLIFMALPTAVFMAAQVSMVYFFTKLRFSALQAFLIMLGCIAGFVAAKHQGAAIFTMFASLLGIFAASSLGYLVSLRITDKNLLLPVVMFAACIDFWTVSRGPVFHMIKHVPGVVAAVSAPIPRAGAGAFVPSATIGPGDFLFIALIFAAVHRLGMNSRRNFWFVFAAMLFGMGLVMFGIIQRYTALPGLPALTVLAVAVVAANGREFKLSRQEAISTAIAGALLAGSVAVVWRLAKPALQTKPAVRLKAAARMERAGSRPVSRTNGH